MPADHVQFGDFVLDHGAYQLRRGDELVPLQRIPFELLCLLVERHGQIVTREEILERVWGKGVFVDIESGINTAIRKLRRALGDDSDAPHFVVTVPTRGYRFVAEIRESKGESKIDGEAFRPRSSSAMVGRGRELASLLGGLDEAAARRGSLFLISGEPGVGKTRLANEVAVVAQAQGIALMVGLGAFVVLVDCPLRACERFARARFRRRECVYCGAAALPGERSCSACSE